MAPIHAVGELESTEEFIKKGDLKSLQFLYRSGSKGFILGAEEVLKYLVQKEAFGESLTEKDLAELQKEFFVDTLRGKRKKTKALKDLRYLAYEGSSFHANCTNQWILRRMAKPNGVGGFLEFCSYCER